MKKLATLCFLLAALVSWQGAALAAYHHMDEKDAPRFQQAYPDKTGTKLDDCALCHKGNTYTTKSGSVVTESACQVCHSVYGYDGTGDITKTLNLYGAAYSAAGRSVAAFTTIENDDADADGFSNKAEIDAVRYPGDPLDTPDKVPAPHIVYSLEELEDALTPHEQFMLMNTSRGGETGKDYYASYTGFVMQDLMEAAGWKDASSGITVTAPDGFSYTYARTSNGKNYYIEGDAYPQAQYYYDPTVAWVDYSAPGCTGRTNGQTITVDGGLKLMLAYKANGADLDISYLDDQNKLVGEGPFRAVPPQWNPGYPDRQATDINAASEPWPYDKNEVQTDHNAGFSARAVAAIRVDPLPQGTTEYDWRNSQTDAGWSFINDKKVVIYGNLKSGAISGTVLSLLGQPIANALVQTTAGGYEALTDANGAFVIQGVVSGPDEAGKTYGIQVSAESYRSQTKNATVTDGGETAVEFRLIQGSDSQNLCPVNSIKENAGLAVTFRTFRDRVLAKSAAGKKYIRAYYACAPEVTIRLLGDRGLRSQAAALLKAFAAPARALASGKPAVITAGQLKKVSALAAGLKPGASRKLALAIEHFEADLASGALQQAAPFRIQK